MSAAKASPPPVNRYRGEVGAVIDGEPRVLCLTLRSLAELEDAFGVDDLDALSQRFASGVSAADIATIIAAGLRGGGTNANGDAVATMRFEGGAAGAAKLCRDLLTATFGAAR